MAINKLHDEFHTLDMSSGWETPAGYPAGIQQKILSGALDEVNKRGSRTRLLRFAPGVYTTTPFVHEYWEEVFLFSGDLTVGNDAKGDGGESFKPNTYACRPPGAYHGPFKSEAGCLLMEIHYSSLSLIQASGCCSSSGNVGARISGGFVWTLGMTFVSHLMRSFSEATANVASPLLTRVACRERRRLRRFATPSMLLWRRVNPAVAKAYLRESRVLLESRWPYETALLTPTV